MSLAFELCCNLKLYLRLHNTPEMTVDGFSDIASRGENRKTCISKIANYCITRPSVWRTSVICLCSLINGCYPSLRRSAIAGRTGRLPLAVHCGHPIWQFFRIFTPRLLSLVRTASSNVTTTSTSTHLIIGVNRSPQLYSWPGEGTVTFSGSVSRRRRQC